MRSFVLSIVLLLSFSAHAKKPLADQLFSELKSSEWSGSFHFEVYTKLPIGNKITVKVSDEYPINVQFTDSLTDDRKIPYFFSKDVSHAKGFDRFVFDKIDVQECEGEARDVQILDQNDDKSYSGVVFAPECKDGKERTVKQLNLHSIKRNGDSLQIVLADKAIGDAVTFRVFYKFKLVNE